MFSLILATLFGESVVVVDASVVVVVVVVVVVLVVVGRNVLAVDGDLNSSEGVIGVA